MIKHHMQSMFHTFSISPPYVASGCAVNDGLEGCHIKPTCILDALCWSPAQEGGEEVV